MRAFGLKFVASLIVTTGVALLCVISLLSLLLSIFLGAAEALLNKMDWLVLQITGSLKPVRQAGSTAARVPEDSAHSHGGGNARTVPQTERDDFVEDLRRGSGVVRSGDHSRASETRGHGTDGSDRDPWRDADVGHGPNQIERERLAAGSLAAGDPASSSKPSPSQVVRFNDTDEDPNVRRSLEIVESASIQQ